MGLKGANDASVAFLGVIALFCLPNGEGGKLLDWETAVKVPWGLLLLVSSGVALGVGFAESGLSAALAGLLGGLGNLAPVVIILVIALVVTFLTERRAIRRRRIC